MTSLSRPDRAAEWQPVTHPYPDPPASAALQLFRQQTVLADLAADGFPWSGTCETTNCGEPWEGAIDPGTGMRLGPVCASLPWPERDFAAADRARAARLRAGRAADDDPGTVTPRAEPGSQDAPGDDDSPTRSWLEPGPGASCDPDLAAPAGPGTPAPEDPPGLAVLPPAPPPAPAAAGEPAGPGAAPAALIPPPPPADGSAPDA